MENIIAKRCIKCGEKKSPSEFYKDDKRKDGLQSFCKICSKSYYRLLYRTKHPLKRFFDGEKKSCSICHQVKPVSEFAKRSKAKTGYKAECKECGCRYEENRKRKDTYRIDAQVRNQNSRARRLGVYGIITYQDWINVLDRYGNKCLVPGCKRADITMDHVKPFDIGGTNTPDNLQPLCLYHNDTKGRKHIDYRL